MEKRKEALEKLTKYRKSLSESLSEAKKHEKELLFTADNGIRQRVYPRIGEFADHQSSVPVHNEINAWQHLLNTIYQEALRRGLIEELLEVLSSPLQAQDAHLERTTPSTSSSYLQGAGDRGMLTVDYV